MALKKTIAKLDDYFERLSDRKAKRIKVKHVEKIIAKLEAKKAELQREVADAKKPGRKDRLERKLKVVAGQIEKAQFLLSEIEKSERS